MKCSHIYAPNGTTPSPPSYLGGCHGRGLYQQHRELGNRPLPSPAFSPLPLLSILILSFLTFICYARINPCAQHPWGVVHRHGPLVYVRLTVCNTLLQDLIEPDWPSSIYGVTWLQVYSYYNSHCSRDRWPLKSFVRAHTCDVTCSGS